MIFLVPVAAVYGLLIASCGTLDFIDLAVLATWSMAGKVAALIALATLPMLFSGIVFIDSLDRTPDQALT